MEKYWILSELILSLCLSVDMHEIAMLITFVLENLVHSVEEPRLANGQQLAGTIQVKHEYLDDVPPRDKHTACSHKLFKYRNTFQHNYCNLLSINNLQLLDSDCPHPKT